MANAPQDEYKLVIIGGGGVGKTTYIKHLQERKFVDVPYQCTPAYKINPIAVRLQNGRVIKCNVWDTSGQEKPGELRDPYYDGGDAFLFMLDKTSKRTLKDVKQWIRDVRRSLNGRNVPMVIVGNKADESDIKVKESDESQLSKQEKIPYYAISNKTSTNVYEPLQFLLSTLVANQVFQLNAGNVGALSPPSEYQETEAEQLAALQEAANQGVEDENGGI